jgi:DNA-binding NarL/FixJ family response regulator
MKKEVKKNNTKPISILLADDHVVVRKGLITLLEMEPDLKVIAEAEDGEEAVALYKKHKPLVTIMDLAMAKLNGIEAARQIKKMNPRAIILVLSAHSDDNYIEKIMDLQLAGYLIKQCAPDTLVDAIRLVAQGKTYFSPLVTDRIKLLDRRPHTDTAHSSGPYRNLLSTREAEVLQLVAEGKANKQIADELKISIKTVEKHRQNLMNKLGIHDTAGLTRYAIAEGYITCVSHLG